MCDGICVCCDEETAWILSDAQGGILQLVVVHIAIESDNDGADIWIVLHLVALCQLDSLFAVFGTAQVLKVLQFELLKDANFANDVDLLAAIEIDIPQISRSGK